jgi:hypothetical protein
MVALAGHPRSCLDPRCALLLSEQSSCPFANDNQHWVHIVPVFCTHSLTSRGKRYEKQR